MGLFCLDGIASGTIWTDMKDLEADIFLTAPRKDGVHLQVVGSNDGWKALERLENTESNSTLDLKKWVNVTDATITMDICTIVLFQLIPF